MKHFTKFALPISGQFRASLQFHLWPVLLLLCIALLASLFFWNTGFEERWTSDTTDTFYRIVMSTPGEAVRGGGLVETLSREVAMVFTEQPATDWYQGIFDAYLRSFHLAWGDISMAYKVTVFPLLLIFSLGVYAFFWALTGHRWLALALTLAALLPMPLSWAGERSGFGPIWNYTRRYFFTAWVPVLTWLFYSAMLGANKRMLLLALAGVGLASNLHASGIILLEIFAFAWFLAGPLSPLRAIKMLFLVGFGMAFSMTAIASLWTKGASKISELLFAGAFPHAIASVAILPLSKDGVIEGLQYLFYPPRIYRDIPLALVDVWLLLTLFLSILPLVLRRWGGEAHRLALFAGSALCLLFVSFEQMWPWVILGASLYYAGRKLPTASSFTLSCYLVIATFWVAVGGMLALQIAYQTIDGFPLVFNQLRGIRFMGFWVFVWCAGLAFPLLGRSGQIERRALIAILCLTLTSVFVSAKEFKRQYFTSQKQDYAEKKRALLDIAVWAKRNTAKQAIFLVGSSAFGILAERMVFRRDKEVRDQRIDWLPPRGILPPVEAADMARRENVNYFFISGNAITADFVDCVKVANAHFALVEVSCANKVRPLTSEGRVGDWQQKSSTRLHVDKLD